MLFYFTKRIQNEQAIFRLRETLDYYTDSYLYPNEDLGVIAHLDFSVVNFKNEQFRIKSVGITAHMNGIVENPIY